MCLNELCSNSIYFDKQFFFKKKLTRMHKFLAVDFLSISYDQTIHELHPR